MHLAYEGCLPTKPNEQLPNHAKMARRARGRQFKWGIPREMTLPRISSAVATCGNCLVIPPAATTANLSWNQCARRRK